MTFECQIPSAEEFTDHIEKTLKKYPYLVAEENGEIFGYAYVSTYDNLEAYNWAAELSVYVASESRS